MRKQGQIIRLLDCDKYQANEFWDKVVRSLPGHTSVQQVIDILEKLQPEKRTWQEVVLALGGMPKKSGWQQYNQLLEEYNVKRLYHFTDLRNISSIIHHQGLYSWHYCQQNGINIPCPGGNRLSRELDVRNGNEDYVHLSFNHNPRMLFSVEGIRSAVVLKINPSVVCWESTKFSDVNSVDNMANIGDDLEAFTRIRFDVALRESWKGFMERKWRQAEVLVRRHVPLCHIMDP